MAFSFKLTAIFCLNGILCLLANDVLAEPISLNCRINLAVSLLNDGKRSEKRLTSNVNITIFEELSEILKRYPTYSNANPKNHQLITLKSDSELGNINFFNLKSETWKGDRKEKRETSINIGEDIIIVKSSTQIDESEQNYSSKYTYYYRVEIDRYAGSINFKMSEDVIGNTTNENLTNFLAQKGIKARSEWNSKDYSGIGNCEKINKDKKQF